MSAEVRLDAATLEWVAQWCDCQAAARYDHARGDLEAVAMNCRQWRNEARSRPPALSDWIRSCEGTGLRIYSADVSMQHCDVVLEDVASADARAIVKVDVPTGPFGYKTHEVRCSTPAELRAALEALASEVKP